MGMCSLWWGKISHILACSCPARPGSRGVFMGQASCILLASDFSWRNPVHSLPAHSGLWFQEAALPAATHHVGVSVLLPAPQSNLPLFTRRDLVAFPPITT